MSRLNLILLACCLAAGLKGADPARLALVDDDAFLAHNLTEGHPESPQRLIVIRQAIAGSPLATSLLRLTPRPANRDDLLLVHDADYLERVERDIAGGRSTLSTGDTRLSPGSGTAARLAVGALLGACDAVMAGRVRRAFCAVRPPGHHAGPAQGMGFCIYSNVAIAARHLMIRHQLDRVLVVDVDVHHGNGTYAALKAEPRAFQFHFHQLGIYPGSGVQPGMGRADEAGEGPAIGHTINLPLAPGSGNEAFLAGLRERLAPAMAVFQPQFILVSAGYDAHQDDPLGGLKVTTEGYRQIYAELAILADRHCQGRLVAALEGGYHASALGASVLVTLEALARSGADP